MRALFLISFLFSLSITYGQGVYPPVAGMSGSTAIHKDSSVFVSWGNTCEIKRGYQQIDSAQLGKATHGDSTNSANKADGITVSLGDSGVAIYTLSQPIFNGTGADFAVFENSFDATFLELAFVEVSSDGIHYFRFPAFSNTQDTAQIGTFGNLNATNLHNLAGKYQVNYGTPFDLDELPNNSLLNKGNITHIKIVDVIGNISPEYATFDSQNNKINDPWPTPFSSSGFDLDALGLIHVNGINSLSEKKKNLSVYPNPFTDFLTVNMEEEIVKIELVSMAGISTPISLNKKLNLSHLKSGVYYLKIATKTNFYVQKVVKK